MPADPISTNRSAVFEAVRERLVSEGIFTDDNLLITDSDDPPGEAAMFWGALWPIGGAHDEAAFQGGGHYQTWSWAGFSLSIFRQNPLDSVGVSDEFFLGTDPLGLLEIKRLCLKALAGHRLQNSGDFLLLEELRPIRSDNPRVQSYESGRVADIYLEFATPFAWDLDN